MDNQKIDRRTRKTKKILTQALTKLMSEKKINNITVRELTDIADVNRSTFYFYYKDIFDMVEKIETEMLADFDGAFNKFAKEAPTHDNLLSFFLYLFGFAQNNAEICKILLGSDGDYAFIEKLKETIRQYPHTIPTSYSETKAHYYIPFIISGCIGTIQQWLNDDMKVSPKEMAAIIIEML
ncbi:division inhibitor protein [Clostridium puniceum]|uniref:Division inhibitor protein n=1 Tax=Clostridium puniceum TaxID=29367 RepID=A0A1S8T7V4_9CLOT|nr:TetR/AcrR family transcriptional regulator [Clostridium puniceum]OOM73823.1 division inhibitor protein [Clostridium puniceum]